MRRFDQEWMAMMRRDINHPSIITWTLVNESWGYDLGGGDVRQRNHIRSLYYQTKSLDPTRAINDNCGWEHVQTDLSTFHDYADANGMRERCQSLKEIIGRGRSMFLSKFSTTIPNHHIHTTSPPLLHSPLYPLYPLYPSSLNLSPLSLLKNNNRSHLRPLPPPPRPRLQPHLRRPRPLHRIRRHQHLLPQQHQQRRPIIPKIQLGLHHRPRRRRFTPSHRRHDHGDGRAGSRVRDCVDAIYGY